jgi:hypothetical protein
LDEVIEKRKLENKKKFKRKKDDSEALTNADNMIAALITEMKQMAAVILLSNLIDRYWFDSEFKIHRVPFAQHTTRVFLFSSLKEDRIANERHTCALQKLKFLPVVVSVLQK